jgi:plastocyanin
MKELSRRSVLRLGGVVGIGALAGCTGGTATGEGLGTDQRTDAPTTRPTDTPTRTATAVTQTPDERRYRVDQRGGPENLLSDPTIRAIDIPDYDGPAPYVFTPAILWAETGSTVTWAVDGGTHAIAAYHPDVYRTQRIPDGAASFDSGIVEPGDSFEHTFETPGVYNYLCQPHEEHGMVGLVVVGEARPGPGTVDGSNVQTAVAGEHLTRLLDIAGIDVQSPE